MRPAHKPQTTRCLVHTCQLSLKTGPLAYWVKAHFSWWPGKIGGAFSAQLTQDPSCLGLPIEGAVLTHFQLHLCKVKESRAGTVRRGRVCYGETCLLRMLVCPCVKWMVILGL